MKQLCSSRLAGRSKNLNFDPFYLPNAASWKLERWNEKNDNGSTMPFIKLIQSRWLKFFWKQHEPKNVGVSILPRPTSPSSPLPINKMQQYRKFLKNEIIEIIHFIYLLCIHKSYLPYFLNGNVFFASSQRVPFGPTFLDGLRPPVYVRSAPK